jgi:hypothetical protein
MSCLGRVVQTMIHLLLVRFLLLVLVLVPMCLTPPTLLTQLLWSLLCLPYVQLLMSSTRASPMMRLPCWRESFELCIGSVRRGGDLLRAALSAVTPLTSSPTTLSGRSLTPPTSTTTTTRMIPATWTRERRSTTSEIKRRRRSSRR